MGRDKGSLRNKPEPGSETLGKLGSPLIKSHFSSSFLLLRIVYVPGKEKQKINVLNGWQIVCLRNKLDPKPILKTFPYMYVAC